MQIGIEDFRVMTESFGMQLDDDSLLALFSRVSSLTIRRLQQVQSAFQMA